MGILNRLLKNLKSKFKDEESNHAQKSKEGSAFSSGYGFIYQTRDLCVNCNFALEKKLSYCNQCGVSV